MLTIAIANRKGGVGKSTLTVNLAAALGAAGHRVLVVDMDSQGSATAALLPDLPPDAPSMADVLARQLPIRDTIRPSTSDAVSIAPAKRSLTDALLTIVSKTGRELLLRNALTKVAADFDLCLIDNAPEAQLGTANSLVAASHVLMPFTPDPKALEGLATTQQLLEEVRQSGLNDHVDLLGCVQMIYDRRLGVTDDARGQVAEAFRELLFATTVRTNSVFIVSPAWHRDIFQLEAKERSKKGSEDFAALAVEFTQRLKLRRVRAGAA
jgi:chromosome partitioning protein